MTSGRGITNNGRMTAEFVGVDGEGITVNGYHQYRLLRAGDRVVHLPSSPLAASMQALAFLTRLPRHTWTGNRHKTRIHYLFFYGDYDVTMMLRPFGLRLRQLWDDTGEVAGMPLRIGGCMWTARYIPGKLFMLIPTKGSGHTNLIIEDVSGFSHASWTKVARDWHLYDKHTQQLIEDHKSARHRWDRITPDIVNYNRLECEALAIYGTNIKTTAASLGLNLRRYHGAGALARCLADTIQVHRWTPGDNAPPDVPVQWAYYAGRFETSRVGPVGSLHEYDIVSAYPAAITNLPCLQHARWEHHRRRSISLAPHNIYLCEWDIPGRIIWGPFPLRHRNRLYYPAIGRGWYYGSEVAAAMRLYPHHIRLREMWELQPQCLCQPFAPDLQDSSLAVRLGIAGLFHHRRMVGPKTAQGMLIKIALNSLYGIFAATKGRRTHTVPTWAGMITAMTRARLLNAIAETDHENVVMLATDSIATIDPLPVPCTSELGGWEHAILDNVFIVKPGLYFAGGHTPIARTRGHRLAALRSTDTEQRFRDAWDHEGTRAIIGVSEAFALTGWDFPDSFITIRDGLHRNDPASIGTWTKRTTHITMSPWDRKVPDLSDDDIVALAQGGAPDIRWPRTLLAPSTLPGTAEPFGDFAAVRQQSESLAEQGRVLLDAL